MAVILVEGFEANTLGVFDQGQPGGGAIIKSSLPAPAGPWSKYYFQAGTGTGGLSVDANNGDIYGEIRFYADTSKNIIVLMDAGAQSCCTIFTSGALTVCAGGNFASVFGTNPLIASTWNLIEFHVRVGNATGNAGTWGLCDIRLNGLSTPEISLTNIDTQPGTSTSVSFVQPAAGIGGGVVDDIILYDSTGSINNTWVGDKGVAGLAPNAKGSQNDWDPDGKTTGVARWYFPLPTVYFPSISPTPDASWEITKSDNLVLTRGELADQKRGTTVTTAAISQPYTFTTGQDFLMGQFISPPLAAQTISGTAKMYMQVRENNIADDTRSQLVLRVVSIDGSTVRGVLYAGDTGSLTSEWDTIETNRAFPRVAAVPVTLSSLAISTGDRLVVEFGGRGGASRSGATMRVNLGDSNASDLPEDETTTTLLNPWIQFSSAITLSQEGNFEFVDDVSFSPTAVDDDFTFVSTSTDNDIDLYNYANLPTGYSVSGPISVKMRVKKVDAGPRLLALAYKTSGATQASVDKGVPTSFAMLKFNLDSDATTSTAWDDTKVNSLQAGPKARP